MDPRTSTASTERPKIKYENETDTEEDLLADYFEKSASAVRQTFGRFEQDVARPIFDYVTASFRERPVLSTFVAFYLTLSVLPVVSFIGLSIFIIATSIFVALASAVFFSSGVLGFFGFWLASALIFFLFVSFNLTLSTAATYLFVQFILRVRADGFRPALSSLYADIRTQLSFARPRGRKHSSKPLQPLPSVNVRQSSAGAADEGVAVKAPAKDASRDSESDTLVIVGVGGESPEPSPQATKGPTPARTNAFGEKVAGIPDDGPA